MDSELPLVVDIFKGYSLIGRVVIDFNDPPWEDDQFLDGGYRTTSGKRWPITD